MPLDFWDRDIYLLILRLWVGDRRFGRVWIRRRPTFFISTTFIDYIWWG